MSEQEILETLGELLKEATENKDLDVSEIGMDDDIFLTYGVTSIAALYLAFEIENRFGVSLLNEDVDKIKTPRQIIALIQGKK